MTSFNPILLPRITRDQTPFSVNQILRGSSQYLAEHFIKHLEMQNQQGYKSLPNLDLLKTNLVNYMLSPNVSIQKKHLLRIILNNPEQCWMLFASTDDIQSIMSVLSMDFVNRLIKDTKLQEKMVLSRHIWTQLAQDQSITNFNEFIYFLDKSYPVYLFKTDSKHQVLRKMLNSLVAVDERTLDIDEQKKEGFKCECTSAFYSFCNLLNYSNKIERTVQKLPNSFENLLEQFYDKITTLSQVNKLCINPVNNIWENIILAKSQWAQFTYLQKAAFLNILKFPEKAALLFNSTDDIRKILQTIPAPYLIRCFVNKSFNHKFLFFAPYLLQLFTEHKHHVSNFLNFLLNDQYKGFLDPNLNVNTLIVDIAEQFEKIDHLVAQNSSSFPESMYNVPIDLILDILFCNNQPASAAANINTPSNYMPNAYSSSLIEENTSYLDDIILSELEFPEEELIPSEISEEDEARSDFQKDLRGVLETFYGKTLYVSQPHYATSAAEKVCGKREQDSATSIKRSSKRLKNS